MQFRVAECRVRQVGNPPPATGFRHLVAVEDGQVSAIISMRDIIHVWRPR